MLQVDKRAAESPNGKQLMAIMDIMDTQRTAKRTCDNESQVRCEPLEKREGKNMGPGG